MKALKKSLTIRIARHPPQNLCQLKIEALCSVDAEIGLSVPRNVLQQETSRY